MPWWYEMDSQQHCEVNLWLVYDCISSWLPKLAPSMFLAVVSPETASFNYKPW